MPSIKTMDTTYTHQVIAYINDVKISDPNQRVCLILGVIYSCKDLTELENISNIITESNLSENNKNGLLNTIQSFIVNLRR
jgi:hypothetical protein